MPEEYGPHIFGPQKRLVPGSSFKISECACGATLQSISGEDPTFCPGHNPLPDPQKCRLNLLSPKTIQAEDSDSHLNAAEKITEIITTLRQDLTKVNGVNATLQRELESTDQLLKTLKHEIRDLRNQFEAKQRELDMHNKQHTKLIKQINILQQELAHQRSEFGKAASAIKKLATPSLLN